MIIQLFIDTNSFLSDVTNFSDIRDLSQYKRKYSVEDVFNIYNNDYINFTLKNIILTNNVKYGFFKIKDLNIFEERYDIPWRDVLGDPFLQETHNKKINLGLDIIKNGTYWPFIVSPENNEDLYVHEGNHRILSLKICQEKGYIDNDFKVFCIIPPYKYNKYNILDFFKEIQTPYFGRFIIENMYGEDWLKNDFNKNYTVNKIISSGGRLVNGYTGEIKMNKVADIAFCLLSYPLYLRNIIYEYRNYIKPNRIINDENVFNEWIKGV